MAQFNLLHISDLHISISPMREEIFFLIKNFKQNKPALFERYLNSNICASHNPNALRFLAKFIYQTKDYIDAIVITGDVATTGSSDDLEEAKKILSFAPYSDSDLVPPYLNDDEDESPIINGNLNIPIILLPGNHDRYQIEKYTFNPIKPGGTNFFEVFRDMWRENHVNVSTIIKEETHVLGIIAADFSLIDATDATMPQYIARLAQGRIYPDILEELVSKTSLFIKACQKQNKLPLIVWAIHFPPAFPHKKFLAALKDYFFKSLLEEDKLIYQADYNQISLIMAGHTHQPAFYDIPIFSYDDRLMCVQCSGSSSQYYNFDIDQRQTNYCHIVTFDCEEDELLTSVRNFKLDVNQGGFIEV
jgi:predicted phosphodiesterase